MQRKRIIAMCLATAMAFTTLVGCGKEEVKTASTSSSAEEKTSEVSGSSVIEEVEEPDPYTVTYWMYGTESPDHEMVMEAVNEKIQEYLPNTTLEMVYVSASEYKDRYTKALAAGEKIDLAWSAGWVNPVSEDVYNEVVLPVEDLIKEHGDGIVDALGWTILDNHHSVDGELYFIPSWQGLVGGRYGLILDENVLAKLPDGWLEDAQQTFFDNTDFTLEAAQAKVKVLDEYLEAAATNGLLRDGVFANGAELGTAPMYWTGIQYKYASNTCYVVEEDGVFTVGSWFESDPIRLSMETAARWYDAGYVRSDVASMGNVASENFIVWYEQAIAESWFEKNEATYEKSGNKFTGMLITPSNELVLGFSTGTVLPYTGENPKRSMQVLNLLFSDAEIYRLLIYGIEGRHYMTNSNGTITIPPTANKSYTGPDNWKVGTCMNGLTEDGNSLTYYQDLKAEEETALNKPLLAFQFDTANVKTQVANCNAVKKEYQGIVQMGYLGSEWEAKYDEFIDKMYDAGLQDVLDELKAQLKVYVEANNLGTVAD